MAGLRAAPRHCRHPPGRPLAARGSARRLRASAERREARRRAFDVADLDPGCRCCCSLGRRARAAIRRPARAGLDHKPAAADLCRRGPREASAGMPCCRAAAPPAAPPRGESTAAAAGRERPPAPGALSEPLGPRCRPASTWRSSTATTTLPTDLLARGNARRSQRSQSAVRPAGPAAADLGKLAAARPRDEAAGRAFDLADPLTGRRGCRATRLPRPTGCQVRAARIVIRRSLDGPAFARIEYFKTSL